jgi:hypothetical protein
MFTIEVKGKKYTVDKVTPRALYEMQPAMDMFNRINEQTQKSLKGEPVEGGKDDLKQAMDVLLDWFVVFCGNKFTKEDLLDGYGADSIMTDIGVALRAAQMGVTEAIKMFPTTARPQKNTAQEAATPASAVSRCRYMLAAWTKAFRRK